MKSFLEEYGFAILAAIVVILLIAICTPVGNSIKSYCLDLVSSFASTANKKLDMADGQNASVTIYTDGANGVKGVITTGSTTDKFTYDVYYMNSGVLQKETYAGPESETTTREFNIAHSLTIDANSDLHIVTKNLGTGEETSSNTIKVMDNLAPVDGIAAGGSGESGGSTISISKGDTLTLGDYEYLVMNVQGNEALVVMTSNKPKVKFHASSNVYETSDLKSLMDDYYNDSENALGVAKDVIVAKDITVGEYSDNSGTPSGDYFAKGQYANGDINNKIDYYITKSSSTTLGNQYVYPLDIEDIVNYLGKDNLTPENIRDTFGLNIWLRSARTGLSSFAWNISGSYYLKLNTSFVGYDTNAVHPAFVLDLSKLG